MTVLCLSKQGEIHLALLWYLVWQLFQLTQSLALEMQVHHIPGKCNVLADSLSQRSPVQTWWAPDQSVSQAMVAHLNAFSVPWDLFGIAYAFQPMALD